MFGLTCQVQNYDWGKRGKDSKVAQLKCSGRFGIALVDDKMPYAELWMGTHPSGPARISASNEFLLDWLRENPTAVGKVPVGYRGGDLPFLFKVLSISTALSIQAHPDKALAQELHTKYPTIYKDPNHKPEMAIALTPFEAMCGFRPIEEIRDNLMKYPELREIVGDEACDHFMAFQGDDSDNSYSEVLKILFRAFMECDDETAQYHVGELVARLTGPTSRSSPTRSRSRSSSTSTSNNSKGGEEGIFQFISDEVYTRSLILRLNKDYPGDRGALCPLLLNCLRLAEGEAFFMGPNEPHAYISGDCVESMALSDNVVRAGLTPKFRDVETLCSMLNYTYGRPHLLPPIILDSYTLLYRPPPSLCAEFEVEVCTLPPNAEPYHPPVVDCGSIFLFFKGSTCSVGEGDGDNDTADVPAEPVPMGTVIFLAASTEITIHAGPDGAVFYRAHVNLASLSS